MTTNPIQRAARIVEILGLRHAILRPGLPIASAHFELDDHLSTGHFGAFLGGLNLAALSLMPSTWPLPSEVPPRSEAPAWQLRGMAVARGYQGQGLGGRLLRFALAEMEARDVWCNARLSAIPFYERLGFEIVSEVFDVPEVGPHRRLLRLAGGHRG